LIQVDKTPLLGTVLSAGNQTLNVSFIFDDQDPYYDLFHDYKAKAHLTKHKHKNHYKYHKTGKNHSKQNSD